MQIAQPELGAGEALVRMRCAGICSTDLEIVRGYAGFVGTLGHEGTGIVEACDDARWVGQRVVGEINVVCGRCERCRRGHRTHCSNRTVMGIRGKDGCFADKVTLPIENLHPVPDHVGDELAVFAEPLAAAFEICQQVCIGTGQRIAVVGDGKLGLLVAMVLVSEGASVHVVGKHDRKLKIAEAAGAIPHHVDAFDEHDLDIVVEATGSPGGLALAIDRVRPRGTLVLKSTFAGEQRVDTNRLVVDEITVVGSRCGPMDRAVAALADGSIDPSALVDARYSLDDGVEAIDHAGRSGTLKVLLQA